MPPPTADVRDILVAKLEVLLQDCEKVMNNTAYGETLNDLDAFLLLEGRAFIKDVFEQKLQELIIKKEQTREAAQRTN